MTDSFAPVEPGTPTESQVPAAPLVRTVSTPPPPVIAPAKKGDRTFRVLLAVGLLVAVGGVTFAVGRVTAPAAAASTRGGLGNGGFANGGAGGRGGGREEGAGTGGDRGRVRRPGPPGRQPSGGREPCSRWHDDADRHRHGRHARHALSL